jgi:predicted RNase H-like HicB family nuclease
MNNNLINFIVNKEEIGYSANAVNFFITTQGDSFDELLKNIREAVDLYFEDEKVKSPYFTIIYSEQSHA